METNQANKALIKFQIGPVQDFIAQARSTRDLWSGSYLLSWLVAKGIRALPDSAQLIFPSKHGQPLLNSSSEKADAKGILTPNLPNIIIAEVPSEQALTIARKVNIAIRSEWHAIASSVWDNRSRFGLDDNLETRFFAQADRHLSIAWQTTPLVDCYADAYLRNGWHLDAVRQTRGFLAWQSETGPSEKDSLSGKEEALVGGTEYQEKMLKRGGEYPSLFSKHADHLGAVNIIKRCWHLAWLLGEKRLPAGSKQFSIRSIPAIAARTTKLDDEELAQEKVPGERYVAAIAFDGDSIGKWVNGDFWTDKNKLAEHHTDFSAALSDFALNRVQKIIEEIVDGSDDTKHQVEVPLGQLIYAGGDDVVALVPADAVLDIATKLRNAFREATGKIAGTDPKTGQLIQPDASAGIAIAHIKSPLQDLIREAQMAEKRAKLQGPRPAFSVTLMKRSGEISHWTAQWDDGSLPLYQAIFDAMRNSAGKILSGRFPHRLTDLLQPYCATSTGLSAREDEAGFRFCEVIRREFLFCAERQGSKSLANSLEKPLDAYLEKASPQNLPNQLERLLGLLGTLAFTIRNLPKVKASV